jgi:hypothetical protein
VVEPPTPAFTLVRTLRPARTVAVLVLSLLGVVVLLAYMEALLFVPAG